MCKKRIVLLHGWGATSVKLIPLANKLKKRGWEVITLKLPGFELPAPDTAWGLYQYAEHVDMEIRKHWKSGNYLVFGHSFGGRIAIKMAQKFPHLQGIMLCASGGLSRGNIIKRSVFWLAAKAGKVLLVIPGSARIFKKVLYKAAREHDYEKSPGIMKEIMKKVVAENLKQAVPQINLPVLILWGIKDKMTPISDAYFLKNKLRRSELIVFKDEGHRLPYNKPSEIAEEIDKWYLQLH